MDVIKSAKTFIRLLQIFGLFPYRLEKSNDFYFLTESPALFRYTKALFWLLTLSDGGSIISYKVSPLAGIKISSKLVLFLSNVTINISFVIIFVTVVQKRRILCFWLNRFNNLCISSPLKTGFVQLERFNHVLLLSTTSYFALLIFTKYLTSEFSSKKLLLSDVVFYMRLWMIHLFLKLFVVLANYVRVYHATIRKALRGRRTAEVPRFWVRVLRKLRSEDLLVKAFVKVVHSIYMPVMLVQLVWFFVTILFDITLSGRAGVPTAMQVQWMIYIGTETFLYVSVCHLVEKEAQKMIRFLQDQFINLDNSELLYEFELFYLQLQHIPLKFNALGFFNLDFTWLYSVIGATTTYSIILIQFQNDSIGKFRNETHNASIGFSNAKD